MSIRCTKSDVLVLFIFAANMKSQLLQRESVAKQHSRKIAGERFIIPSFCNNEQWKMTVQEVCVLRLGHRLERDERATMHIFLTARALSASRVIYAGQRDADLEKRIRDVAIRWGGSFEVEYEKNWKKVIQNWKKRGVACHLTMYGININECLDEIPKEEPVLVIVGSQKVHKDVFQLADYNIAIGNQPHSEIAALAIFLDRFLEGKGLKRKFEKARMRVLPQERGKRVIFETR